MKTFLFCIVFLLLSASFCFSQSTYSKVYPNIVLTGDEVSNLPQPYADVITREPIELDDYYSPNFVWTIHNITNRQTGYDLQSNGSVQEVWCDLNIPSYIHAVFTNSQVDDNAWADRSSIYFGSTDNGQIWFELGQVPVNNGTSGRSGYPCIVGTSDGRAVIANHNNSESTSTHTKIFIDNSPFEYYFTTYDPGLPPFNQGDGIWPIMSILPNNRIVFASSINGGDSFYVNTLYNGVFSGWQAINGDQAETHSLAVSESGSKVGLAYIGGFGYDYWVWYTESSDEGLTWSNPVTVWQAYTDPGTGDILGAIRGVNVTFFGEEPCVVFETGWNTITGYYPNYPSQIRFWSPNINGGVPKIIADSSNVNFYPNKGVADVQYPLSRPVISRSQMSNYLFVAFNATSEHYWPGTSFADSTNYMRGMFMFSTNGGDDWSTPEQFTPSSPVLDWRWISIVPVCPAYNNQVTVHLVALGDTIPGSTVNGWGIMPPGVTAQYYHFSTSTNIVPVELTSFTARLADKKVILNWQTATETNNQGFEVQRKVIGGENEGEWIIRGFINSRGTTTENQSYTFFDDVSDLHCTSLIYRLKQVDFDGSYKFSQEVNVENLSIPYSYELSQNYPNPFNPSTKISYSVPTASKVTLKVFDILGKEITTLINEEKLVGEYEVKFNAINFPSGTYFYQFKAGSFIQTKKMILMK